MVVGTCRVLNATKSMFRLSAHAADWAAAVMAALLAAQTHTVPQTQAAVSEVVANFAFRCAR
jgi:hypothetical protein